MRTLGRIMIDYINNRFGNDKIKRILGDEFFYTIEQEDLKKRIEKVQETDPEIPNAPLQVDPEETDLAPYLNDEGKRMMVEKKMDFFTFFFAFRIINSLVLLPLVLIAGGLRQARHFFKRAFLPF